eukprot:jgi/Hompol1/5390/HPOL_004373-RA
MDELFGRFGAISSIETNYSGFAFVQFATPSSARDAVAQYNDFVYEGHQLVVELSDRPNAVGNGCLICGYAGHWARDCPKNKQRGTDVKSGKCFKCGVPGHLARFCRGFEKESAELTIAAKPANSGESTMSADQTAGSEPSADIVGSSIHKTQELIESKDRLTGSATVEAAIEIDKSGSSKPLADGAINIKTAAAFSPQTKIKFSLTISISYKLAKKAQISASFRTAMAIKLIFIRYGKLTAP